MASRWRGQNFNRFHCTDQRNEYNIRNTRPKTNQKTSDYTNYNGLNNKVIFKSKDRGVKPFRKSWNTNTNLVRKQFNGEFSNQNGPDRNNRRKSYPTTYNSRHSVINFNSSFLTKSATGWYAVVIPNVGNYSDEILKTIQTSIMPIVFYPFNKHLFRNGLKFLVDNFRVAKTLLNANLGIKFNYCRKLVIKVNAYSPPHSITSLKPVSSEVKEKMVEAIMLATSHYNTDKKCLDLSKFHTCPLFIKNRLFVPLNRPAVLLVALNIVAQQTNNDLYSLSLSGNSIYLGEGLVWIRRLFPDLKVLDLSGNEFTDLKELKSLAGFSIKALRLSGNPLSITRDIDKYKHDVQQYFPFITELDDSKFQSLYNINFRPKFKMPINLGNCYLISEVRNPQQLISLIDTFLMDYYKRYDNNVSRQSIAEAYHKNASFSLSSHFMLAHKTENLTHYMSESRNFLKPDTKIPRKSLVHQGRDYIVHFLNMLPKTKHDLGSFVVDVPFVNTRMIQIVVNGVFADDFKVNHQKHLYRSFCRTFCIESFDVGWRIVSDMMFIALANEELVFESAKRFNVLKLNSDVLNEYSFSSNSDNVSISMEGINEMGGIELHYSTPVNFQPPRPNLSDLQTSTIQNHSIRLQSEEKNPAFEPVNQLASLVSLDSSICHANATLDSKLAMINRFSSESGMNDKWTKKCLEDNNWDYAKAAYCFSKLKEKVPSVAFKQKTQVP